MAEKCNENLLSLIELSQTLSQIENFETVLATITSKAADFLCADDAYLFIVDSSTQQTIKTLIHDPRRVNNPTTLKAQILVNEWILKQNQTCFIPNAIEHDIFANTTIAGKIKGSIIATPLRAENRVIGAIVFTKSNKFDKNDLAFAEHLSAIISPYFRDANNLQKYFQKTMPDDALLLRYRNLGLVGKCPRFVSLLRDIDAVAKVDVRVLLEGQSGTGKELIARAIHKLSGRNNRPFIAIDCGAIPANLMESELFGHVRGAFTGASYDRKGLIEEGNTGTIFLDEIANMPIDIQSKFLRILQEGEIKPVGSNKPRKVDVRIISASSSSLKTLMKNQEFREDLFYRLYVYPLVVPSLSERKQDIPTLAEHFLFKFTQQQNKSIHSFHPDILEFMQYRLWTGNIRELENFIERLVTITPQTVNHITYSILPPDLSKEFKKHKSNTKMESTSMSLTDHLTEIEEEAIRKALEENNWNQSKAARSLGISEYAIRYKMSNLGIKKPDA